MKERVIVREVGLRDGLQMVRAIVPTESKLDWLHAEFDAGVPAFEVTSFVPPKSFPQFADAEEVAKRALRMGLSDASVLAVNVRGAMRALDVGVQHLNYVVSASDAHSRANVRATVEEAIDGFRAIVRACNDRGLRKQIRLTCGIATAFGCTIQGEVAEDRVLGIAEQLLDAGADEIMLADTVGYANPTQVRRLFTSLSTLAGGAVAAHFHDSRGLGLANVVAALDAGVRRFDASLGGLGGCPFAPGASGNICIEDCVFLLESMGLDTGIDLARLIAVRQQLSQWMPGEPLGGAVACAGLPRTFV